MNLEDISNSFYSLVSEKDEDPFVDKTDLIADLNKCLNKDYKKFKAVTRPRRFGKTVTAEMLELYYSKKYKSEEIFADLKISKDPSFLKYINKFNVIYWDMNDLDRSYNKLKSINKFDNFDMVDNIEYQTILTLKENKDFNKIIGNLDLSLGDLIIKLREELKEQFIIIIDEWDLIFREFPNDFKLQKKLIKFFNDLFKAKNASGCFALVYMTGILPIKKYQSNSLLNNFEEYNMLEPFEFAKYFGFTDDEVKDLIEKYTTKVTYQELKDWYDGYKLASIDIYNPNSVSLAIRKNCVLSYFKDSANNEDLFDCINMDLEGLKADVLSLLDGKKIPFSSDEFQNNVTEIRTKNDVFCLLVCLGYLACEDIPKSYKNELIKFDEVINDSLSENNKLAFIPNTELKRLIDKKVTLSNWNITKESRKLAIELTEAITKDFDEERASELFTNYYHSGKVSSFDKSKEYILRLAFIDMINPYAENIYVVKQEDILGLGRADIVYLPKPGYVYPYYPIIIELKIDKSTKKAMDQIIAKKYYREYSELYTDLILVGVNYNSKKQLCDFKITKYSDLINSLS